LQGDIFKSLGNSASSLMMRWEAEGVAVNGKAFPRVGAELPDAASIKESTARRHPEPSELITQQITDPKLLVRGTWKRVRFSSEGKKAKAPPPRINFARAVHKSKQKNSPFYMNIVTSLYLLDTYYIFGGQDDAFERFTDGWALDLRNIESKWRKTGSLPHSSKCAQQKLETHQDKAYLFQGSPKVLVFDFNLQTWASIQTRLEDRKKRWSDIVNGNHVDGYASVTHGGRLYVFGGRDENGSLPGKNILISLCLEQMEWRIHSGTVKIKPDATIPGPRCDPLAWVADDKLFISMGCAKRMGSADHHANRDYQYRDMWSYDFAKEMWVQEKLSGSSPAQRTETAHVFNEKLNHLITFGGYTTSIHYYIPSANAVLDYSYLGDTFMWSPETQWRQVISRSFPAYRAAPDMFSDPNTGRTFLYGGCELGPLRNPLMTSERFDFRRESSICSFAHQVE
jgi:hypothetical protein